MITKRHALAVKAVATALGYLDDNAIDRARTALEHYMVCTISKGDLEEFKKLIDEGKIQETTCHV